MLNVLQGFHDDFLGSAVLLLLFSTSFDNDEIFGFLWIFSKMYWGIDWDVDHIVATMHLSQSLSQVTSFKDTTTNGHCCH